LFLLRQGRDILIVQVYVDDIVFGGSSNSLVARFAEDMSKQEKMLMSGIHPGYSCKEGRIVEDGLLVEFPCTPTRNRSVYSY
jgi:hypothetical protein